MNTADLILLWLTTGSLVVGVLFSFYWPSRMPQSLALGLNGQIKKSGGGRILNQKTTLVPVAECRIVVLNAS